MNKVLVIGLDGVPLTLLEPWARQGKLPAIKRLIDAGAVGPLRSTMPATSPVAWSSFMTGKNPGKTGIYDFLYRRPGSYTFPPISRQHRDGAAVWDLLSRAGKRVGVLNVPLTYPPSAVNGFQVSGWMTPPRARDFAYPAEILDELDGATGGYQIYPSQTFSENRREVFMQASEGLLNLRTDAALHLMRRQPWDFFMLVFFDTDRILHQMWHDLDSDHPWHSPNGSTDRSEPVLRYFQRLDEKIDQLVAEAGEDTLVIIMSDHGMGPAHRLIVLNNWLTETGQLHLKSKSSARVKGRLFEWGFTLKNIHQIVDRLGLAGLAEYNSLYQVDVILKKMFLSFDDVEWDRSRAYSFGRLVGPIYLNVKGREPQGIVKPGREYEKVRQEIIDQAAGFRDPVSGERLVGRILLREDIYHGPHLDEAPDLILCPRDERDVFFGLADFSAQHIIEPMYRYSGMHRADGLLVMAGPGIHSGMRLSGANIIDLAPTILHALDAPLPADMDGRPLLAAFTEPPSVLGHPAHIHTNPQPSLRTPAYSQYSGYSLEDARQIETRLRQMGYLG